MVLVRFNGRMSEKTQAVRLRERAWILLVFGVLVVWLVGISGVTAGGAWTVAGVAGFVAGAGMIAYAVWLFTNRPR